MESRLLYKMSQHLRGRVDWLGDPEWFYCGISQDLKTDFLEKHLNEHLDKSMLFIVVTRKLSYPLDFEEAIPAIRFLIDSNDFLLWDSAFLKAIEFNKIGVFRCGSRNE